MLHRIKYFFEKNKEDLPEFLLYFLMCGPIAISACNETTKAWIIVTGILAAVFFFCFTVFKHILSTVIAFVLLWIATFVSVITDGDNILLVMSLIFFIPCTLYYIFSEYGFKKFIRDSIEQNK